MGALFESKIAYRLLNKYPLGVFFIIISQILVALEYVTLGPCQAFNSKTTQRRKVRNLPLDIESVETFIVADSITEGLRTCAPYPQENEQRRPHAVCI